LTAPFDTNSPDLVSWVESANAPETPFPIQNLPYGRFRRDASDPWSIGVAIGDQVLDVHGAGLAHSSEMGEWLTLGRAQRVAQRRMISLALKHGNDNRARIKPWLVPMTEVELGLPCEIRNYSDFFIGVHHAYNTGRLSRPDTPLLSAGAISCDPRGKSSLQVPRCLRCSQAPGWILSWRWASSLAEATSKAMRSPSTRPRSTLQA
jgi:fumarylacetoacetase